MAAFKVFLKRLKALKARKFATKAIKNDEETQRIICSGTSHGFHIVERGDNAGGGSVLAQRVQIEDTEFWLFGAFDEHNMNSGITKYLQTQLFDKNTTEYQIRREAKQVMKKAYISTRAKIYEEEKAKDIKGSTTALVLNGESLVAASFGGYRAVVCRNGLAAELGRKHRRLQKGRWSITDMLHMKFSSSNKGDKANKRSRLHITAQKVDQETEFVILASDGVWEVMRNQEAVDLVGHIVDAQKAAECLAEEALNRMSKSTVACIVIRFH